MHLSMRDNKVDLTVLVNFHKIKKEGNFIVKYFLKVTFRSFFCFFLQLFFVFYAIVILNKDKEKGARSLFYDKTKRDILYCNKNIYTFTSGCFKGRTH